MDLGFRVLGFGFRVWPQREQPTQNPDPMLDFGSPLPRLWLAKTFARLWLDFGSTLARLWLDFGSTLPRLWLYFGSTLAILCSTLARLWLAKTFACNSPHVSLCLDVCLCLGLCVYGGAGPKD
jgi:hypothetical protein